MINLIIFSKDRPIQLHLLLESIKINAENVFNTNIIYTSSNDEYEKGYELLKQRNVINNINWVKQSNDFKQYLLNLLNNEKFEYSCFGTDDGIIFKKFDENIITKTFNEEKNLFTFSLRLGLNVNYCYTMDAGNKVIPVYQDDNIIKWEWIKHYTDFGYPLSVDFHVFNTKEISKLARKISFENPNIFEAGLQIFNNYPKEIMASFKHSVLVNSPNNMVNTTFDNRNGLKYKYNVKELNNKYLSGEIIDFDKLDFSGVIGCHQEMEMGFKKY